MISNNLPQTKTAPKVARPFWNNSEKRVRSGWRLLLQILLFTILMVPFTILPNLIAAPPDAIISLIQTGAMAVAMIGSIFIGGRWIDRRDWRSYGLNLTANWWRQLGFGMLLGAVSMSVVFGFQLLLGWVTISDTWVVLGLEAPFWQAIGVPLVMFILVGVYEELFSRGFQMKNLAEGLNHPRWSPKTAVFLAFILSSIIFGLLHAGNPNATVISSINLSLAGIVLGLGYILTGELAIPMGLHITWNFFQGNVFGFPVSGNAPVGASILQIVQGGPDWMTGGAFGPEAGVIGLLTLLLNTGLILLYVRRRQGRLALHPDIADYQSR